MYSSNEVHFSRKVGERGQVVIPEEIRKIAGIHGGSTVEFYYKEGEIVVKPEQTPQEFLREMIRMIPNEKKRKFDLDKVQDEAYEERMRAWKRK